MGGINLGAGCPRALPIDVPTVLPAATVKFLKQRLRLLWHDARAAREILPVRYAHVNAPFLLHCRQ